MTTTGTILVLGATGKQGGAAAGHLLERGLRVRALVRDPSNPATANLAGRGAELIQADLDDPASLRRPAAGADRGIGIPETDSKLAIERHLAMLDLRVTVLRPTFLMENFEIPELKQAIQAAARCTSPCAPTPRLQMIASDDVGALAALAFDDPDAFPSATELAGDELPMAEVAATFGRVLGHPVQYVAMPHESVARFDPTWRRWAPGCRLDDGAERVAIRIGGTQSCRAARPRGLLPAG
jgi:uncharacterized protein YbjT (DUF2867 family)